MEGQPPLAPPDTLQAVQEAIGYRFRDPALLATALPRPGAPLAPSAARARHRLQFLGDAAWNFSITRTMLRTRPLTEVGMLTRLRAGWSSSAGLADLAKRLKLPLGENITGSPPSNRVWAEALEAVLGAVVEDGGAEAIQALAERVLAEAGEATPPSLDAKSALQILCQTRYGGLPTYRLLAKTGPAHHPRFCVGVIVPGPDGFRVEGEAESRQTAEQAAARLALERVGEWPVTSLPDIVLDTSRRP